MRQPSPLKADLVKARNALMDCLRVFTPEISPEEYAGTLLPLAELKRALARQGAGKPGELLGEAIAHMKSVCNVFPTNDAYAKLLGELRGEYESTAEAKRVPFTHIEAGIGGE